MDEFELIRRYFDRRDSRRSVLAGIGDDGAVLDAGSGVDQIQVVDTLVEGVHFPEGTHPSDIAYRSVAVNLSDIAAMGGQPRWMLLALTIPEADEKWLAGFANGLFAAADEFDVELVGGDTTRGQSTVVTVAMTGEVERGGALLRTGARPGDTIYVTGTIGDAAAGLQQLQNENSNDYLASRFLRPTPRVTTGQALVGRASAAIDISDGLIGDLTKLIRAGGVGAVVDIDRVPNSATLTELYADAEIRQFALGGGDDYELCFTARAAEVSGIPGITAIGEVTEIEDLVLRIDGNIVDFDTSGYRHFQ